MKKNDLIFIVDDDLFFASSLEHFLKYLGFTNIQVYSTANESIKNSFKSPSLIFLDYNLPDLSGEAALLEFLSFDANIPIVVISGQESIGNAINTLKFGAYDYIRKDNLAYDNLKNVINRITTFNKHVLKERLKSNVKKITYALLVGAVVSVSFAGGYYLSV